MEDDKFKDINKHLSHLNNGDVIWISKGSGRKQYSVAGTVDYAKGDLRLPSIRIKYRGKIYKATHIIWFLRKGTLLERGQIIDHIDGNPLNNKINNLNLNRGNENESI